MKKVILFFCFISLISCTDKEKIAVKLLNGAWVIDSIKYNDQDIMNCFTVNGIGFNEDGTCMPPGYFDWCFPPLDSVEQLSGTWKISNVNKKWNLQISTKNKIFNQTYNLNFKVDPNSNILKMYLKSPDLYIECSKILSNPDAANDIKKIMTE